MKIAHIITSMDFGGAERQLLYLADGLRREGHRVVIGCLKSESEMILEFLNSGFPVRLFDMKSAFDARVFFRIRKWLMLESPDLLHTHLFKADVWGGLAGASLGIPLVSTKHNQDPYLKNFFFGLLAKAMAGMNARTVAVSNAVREYIVRSASFDVKKMRVVYIGIPAVDPGKSYSESGNVRFGVVGRMTEQKGFTVLFDAFQQALKSNIEIGLVVYGSGELEQKLREAVRARRLESRIQFCGVTPDLREIYSSMDVLVLPSLWEGAGNVLLEAMAYGIPVIASSVGGIPEYLSDECGLLVPPGDVAALSAAICRMAGDALLRGKFSEVGREHVKKFDFEYTLQAHLRLYHEVLEEFPGNSARKVQP